MQEAVEAAQQAQGLAEGALEATVAIKGQVDDLLVEAGNAVDAAEDARDAALAATITKLDKAANLSDVQSATTARGNLGLGSAAVLGVADTAASQTGTSTALVATAKSVADHVGYNLGITRAQIPTRRIRVGAFQVTGETAVGDLGAGALYVPGWSGGLRAIQDAAGTWWNLTVQGAANVGHFGAKGDGIADDTAAVQLAVNTVCPFAWWGNTRATELNGRSGAVYLPRGTYRMTAVLLLSPNLTIYGEGTGNDWTVRSGATGGKDRLGSALVFDIGWPIGYAVDTAPYNASGVRQYSDVMRGLDSYNGIKTEVHGIVLRDLSIVGSWNSKGLNMAGAVKAVLDNVVISGFHVGIRWTAAWYSSMKNVRIFASWKGLMAWIDVTDLAMYNVSINKHFEAPAYSDTVDAALPPTDAWWTASINNLSAGIVNYYSNLTAYNLTVEGFACYSQGYNAANDFSGVYIEGITTYGIVSKGPDQQRERHKFDTIVTNTCDLIRCNESRLEVECASHNYTQAGFNKLLSDVVAPSRYYLPVIKGLNLKGSDVFSISSMQRSDVLATEGTWTPLLRAGGVSLGTQTRDGRWWRVGNLVTVTGYVQLPTKGGATGALDIADLPFRSRNWYGFEWSSVLCFGFNGPLAGTALRLSYNKYEIEIVGKTHADVSNGADMRFSLTYATDEAGYW